MKKPIWMIASTTIVVFAAVACDDTGLVPAGFPNFVDTVTLYALKGTPISTPSAYDISVGTPVRTDQGQAFDFAFDIDSVGAAIILPAGALGLPAQAGLQMSDRAFEDINDAPYDDYVADSLFTLSVGDVFVGRSRNTSGNCYYLGSLPRYGKFHVVAVDIQNRTMTLETLVNVNCGYRKLEPGFPTS
jgi:hypothetical protein